MARKWNTPNKRHDMAAMILGTLMLAVWAASLLSGIYLLWFK